MYEIRRVRQTEKPHDAATKTVSVRVRTSRCGVPTRIREYEQRHGRSVAEAAPRSGAPCISARCLRPV
jgi:hypothetical protein